MPNHIRNRVTLIGSAEMISELVNSFSTPFERKFRETYEEPARIIYENKTTKEVGWFDEKTGLFERMSKKGEMIVGIPDGFEPDYEEAWTRFPDFDKILPMPKDLSITSSSLGEISLNLLFGHSEKFDFMSLQEKQKRMREMTDEMLKKEIESGIRYWNNVKNHGHKTWYDWSIAHWGTKWNAYSCNQLNETTFEFDTAWSGVPQLIEKIANKFPDVEIVYEYADEDTGSNVGSYVFKNGEIIHTKIENQSNEAYELAFKLRPDYAEGYKMIDGKWQYVDEEETEEQG